MERTGLELESTLYPKKHFSEFVIQNRLFLFFCIILLVGICAGCIFLSGIGDTEQSFLSIVFENFFQTRAKQGFVPTFFASLWPSFILLFILFLLGMSMWAAPVIPVIVLFKGLGLGYCIGYIYSSLGFAGIGYCALMIIPYSLIVCFAIMLASKEAFRLSCSIFKQIIIKQNANIACKKYILRYLVFFILIVLSAFIDALFTVLFAHLFSFV